jgi:hypothetical protein
MVLQSSLVAKFSALYPTKLTVEVSEIGRSNLGDFFVGLVALITQV